MAKYELSSARKDDLENTERDIFAQKAYSRRRRVGGSV